MKNSDGALQSSFIAGLRFPLMLLVVYIHSSVMGYTTGDGSFFDLAGYPVYTTVYFLFTNIICRVAVPLFFFLSAYLLFLNVDRLTVDVFAGKLKRRVRSLLVPYVLWNLIYAGLYFSVQTFFPSLLSGREKAIADYGALDWLDVFWGIKGGTPMAPQFWFVRDLMVYTLLSPVIYALVRFCSGWVAKVALVLLAVVYIFDFTEFNFCPLLFFFLGAFFGIRKVSLVGGMAVRFRKLSVMVYAVAVVLAFASMAFGEKGISVVFGGVSVFAGVMVLSGCASSPVFSYCKRFAPAAFFLFACHGFVCQFLCKAALRIGIGGSDIAATCFYVVMPLAVAAAAVWLHSLLSRLLPGVMKTLDGGR